jgi:hypothetical protein
MTQVSRTPYQRPPAALAKRAAVKPFEAMDGTDKVRLGLETARRQMPDVARGLWANRAAVLKGIIAPYTHPVQSLKAANEAVANSAKEDRLEAALTVAKSHGSLLTAWALPFSIALAPATGGASLIAAIGAAGLGATMLSLGKNVIDASKATSEAELEAQSEQLIADTLELVPNAALHGMTRALPIDEFVPSNTLRSRGQMTKIVSHSVDQADMNQYKEEDAVTLLSRLQSSS